MAAVNYSNAPIEVITSNDTVVVKRVFETIAGGRALDTTGYAPTVIPGGHAIIKETATGTYKPMPVSAGAYAALPSGHEYAGFQNGSVLTSKPEGAIIVRGTINPAASVYDISAILDDIKAALPLIRFEED